MALPHACHESECDARDDSTRATVPAGVSMTDARCVPVEAVRACPALARRFEAIVFDWDGGAVPDRRADAHRLRRLVEQATAEGLELAIVSGTEIDNVDGQLAARPAGPGGLILARNDGSEVFSVDPQGPKLAFRRAATADEDAALSRAAQLTVERLAERGLRAQIVARRPSHCQIDLVPELAWEDPPKVTDRRAGRRRGASARSSRNRRVAGSGEDRLRLGRGGGAGRSAGEQ